MGIAPVGQLSPRHLVLIVEFFALLVPTRRMIPLITELCTRRLKLKSVDMAPFTRTCEPRHFPLQKTLAIHNILHLPTTRFPTVSWCFDRKEDNTNSVNLV